MKKQLSLILVLILGSLVSCSDLEQRLNGTSTLNIQVIHTSAQGQANPLGSIEVTQLEVTQATISVVSPDMVSTEYFWNSYSTGNYEYTARGQGDYTIEVLEMDTGGNISTFGTLIAMTPGYNYDVRINLGGNIFISIDSNAIIPNTNIITNTNSNTNTNTNTNSLVTLQDLQLTIVWHEVPEAVYGSGWVWGIYSNESWNGGIYSNSYPVIVGDATWMVSGTNSWDPAAGKMLTKDFGGKTLYLTTTVPAGSDRQIEFRTVSQLGWTYGMELENQPNHLYTLPISGTTKIDVKFGDTNAYTPDPGTNTNVVNPGVTLQDQMITIIYQNVPLHITNASSGWVWDLQNDILVDGFTNMPGVSPVLTGSAAWMHTGITNQWNPIEAYVLQKYVSFDVTLSNTYFVPAGSPRTNVYKVSTKLGWIAYEGSPDHTLILPESGGMTEFTTFQATY